MALTNTVSQILSLITTGSAAVMTNQFLNGESSNSPLAAASTAIFATSATAQAAGIYLKRKDINFPKSAALWALIEAGAGAYAGMYVAFAQDKHGNPCGPSVSCIKKDPYVQAAVFTSMGVNLTGIIGAVVAPTPNNPYATIQ